MPPETAPPPDTTTQVVRLARFAVLCTLALGLVLLLADLLTSGRTGLLTEGVVRSLLYVAIEVIAATAALTCLAVWKK